MRRIDAVAEHGSVVGSSLNNLAGNPAYAISLPLVSICFGVTAEVHIESNVRPGDFPRIAQTQPLIRDLQLPTITDFLIEDAKFVANSITNRGDLHRCHRFHEACSETAQTSVTNARLLFMLDEIVQV